MRILMFILFLLLPYNTTFADNIRELNINGEIAGFTDGEGHFWNQSGSEMKPERVRSMLGIDD